MVVGTASSADDDLRSKDHTSYGTVQSDWYTAAGLEIREKEWKG